MKNTKKISLSGISTAFCAIFLIMGNTIQVLSYSFYLLASLGLAIPFATNEIKWSFLSFIVASIVGFIFLPDIIAMFSFIVFFGPYVLIVSILKMKRVKKTLQYIIKAIFFALSIYLMYQFSTVFIDLNAYNFPVAVLLGGAFVVMFVYDYLMTRIMFQLDRRVRRFMKMV